MPVLHHLCARLLGAAHDADRDDGFSTAELLGNAALGIAALVVIWAALQGLGLDVVAWVRAQLIGA